MDVEMIKELWRERTKNEAASIALWDGKAASFALRPADTLCADTNMTMRIIEAQHMVSSGSTVLDVGCGTGRYAFALEAMGASVYGTDISPKMIEFAHQQAQQKGSSAVFSVGNWNDLSLEDRGWSEKFDLVLANMTPAVSSSNTFLKLSQASRNWCLMVKPTRRSNSVLDKLNQLVGAPADKAVLDAELAYAFDLLWYGGYRSKLEYETQVWENSTTVEEAVDSYTNRISCRVALGEHEKRLISKYLESVAIDGTVEERTDTTIVAMYWQVINEKGERI